MNTQTTMGLLVLAYALIVFLPHKALAGILLIGLLLLIPLARYLMLIGVLVVAVLFVRGNPELF